MENTYTECATVVYYGTIFLIFVWDKCDSYVTLNFDDISLSLYLSPLALSFSPHFLTLSPPSPFSPPLLLCFSLLPSPLSPTLLLFLSPSISFVILLHRFQFMFCHQRTNWKHRGDRERRRERGAGGERERYYENWKKRDGGKNMWKVKRDEPRWNGERDTGWRYSWNAENLPPPWNQSPKSRQNFHETLQMV